MVKYKCKGDQLTSFGGAEIEYDANGNPTRYYNGFDFTWVNGSELATATNGTNTLSFSYDDNGVRVRKVVNGVEHIYTVNGTQILAEEWEDKLLVYLYDASGCPIGMEYRDSTYADGDFDLYTFQTNMFGDVCYVYNESGQVVLGYAYDAWGNFIEATSWIATEAELAIARLNPFRYRGYYYDTELGLYYLNARYYDPNTGRFISADDVSYLGADGELTGYNLYAYCGNNPIMYTDPTGHMPEWLAWVVSGVAVAFGIALCATGLGGIFGGVLIGSGAGSLINAYSSKSNGGDFLAGYIGGAISGALCGIGAGLGGSAFYAATKATNLACLGYLATSATASFAGGFAGNLIGTVYTSWHNSNFNSVSINWRETIQMSMFAGALNIFAGIGSGAANIVVTATNAGTKLALGILSGAIAGGTEFVYDASTYFLGELLRRLG